MNAESEDTNVLNKDANVLNNAPPKSSKMEKLVILCFKTFKRGKNVSKVSGNSVV